MVYKPVTDEVVVLIDREKRGGIRWFPASRKPAVKRRAS